MAGGIYANATVNSQTYQLRRATLSSHPKEDAQSHAQFAVCTLCCLEGSSPCCLNSASNCAYFDNKNSLNAAGAIDSLAILTSSSLLLLLPSMAVSGLDCRWTVNDHDRPGHLFGRLSPTIRTHLSDATLTVYPGSGAGFFCQSVSVTTGTLVGLFDPRGE